MRGSHTSLLAALCLLCAAPARAALCDVPCDITLRFAAPGRIEASGPTRIDFGPDGSLVLGEGGAIEPGADGEIVPAPRADGTPDMSAGGFVRLGAGGRIRFGTGGALLGGDGGQIERLADDAVVSIVGAQEVVVRSTQPVHVGVLNSAGRVQLHSSGEVRGDDSSSPIHFTLREDDTTTTLLIEAGELLSLASVHTSGQLEVQASGSGGNIEGSGDGGNPPNDGGAGGSIGTGGTGGTPPSEPVPSPDPIEATSGAGVISAAPVSGGGGGALPALTLALLLAAGARRASLGALGRRH